MEKVKQNKIWITIVVIGVVVIAILLAMLHQQKQSTPEAQSSSYIASEKASSASTSVQDTNNEKAYANKATKMKGHVIVIGSDVGSIFYTNMSLSDFKNTMNSWATSYEKMTVKEKYTASVSMGTPKKISNSQYDTQPLDTLYDSIKAEKYQDAGYYESVKEFNKSYPAFNLDDIKK
ncbi:hypothetical protein KII93_05535 [Leuconostoc gelidum subsp. gasicomitatum]|uniref:hypothetical protein n=1 Tax=Leuconostoc gasicomitatum TaxID=115778 RepID=UPI001CC73C91|nr:hypothetical protein [Leuconostoc gasicomitatum]MBZ5947929.1 hypothetical protein [Leuconostoc gasicomitatum]